MRVGIVGAGKIGRQRDGNAAREATGHAQGSAGWAAAMFPKARWVKAYNTGMSGRDLRGIWGPQKA